MVALELGDIIEIAAPGTPLEGQVFFISYIDSDQIDITNVADQTKQSLFLDEGVLVNKSIRQIDLLSRDEERGYARQHGLLPGKWIEIKFGGDIPSIVVGQITNLEEDMIEIKVIPGDQTIYLNFDYQGIPKNLPIESIETREAPEAAPKPATLEPATLEPATLEPATLEPAVAAPDEPAVAAPDEPATLEPVTAPEGIEFDPEEEEEPVPVETGMPKLSEMLLSADQIQFGADLGQISLEVEVSEGKERFGLEQQTNDLLDDLIASIPPNERTYAKMNDIHRVIERYVELRRLFSTFDEAGNILKAKINTAKFRPLVPVLQTLTQSVPWLLPIVKNRKLIYDADEADAEEFNDIISTTLAESQIRFTDALENYYQNTIPDGENKYHYLMQAIQQESLPFLQLESVNDGELLTRQNVKVPLLAITDNNEDFTSTAINRNMLAEKHFLQYQYTPSMKFSGIPHIMDIAGWMMLPKPYVTHSMLALPGVSIYNKANMAQNTLYLFDLLNKKAQQLVKSNIIEDLDEPFNYGSSFLKEIQAFSSEEPLDEASYEKFLESIIPKTRGLIRMIQKDLNDSYTYYTFTKQLEPFLVYTDNTTYKQFVEIQGIINKSILSYKKRMEEKTRDFRFLQSMRSLPANVLHPLFDLLKDAKNPMSGVSLWDSVIKKGYRIPRIMFKKRGKDVIEPKVSSSEIMKLMLDQDCGELFMTAVGISNLGTMSSVDITSALETFKSSIIEPEIEDKAAEDANTCAEMILAKKYIDLDELLEDNNKDVYFDKNLDPTQYDIFENYEEERQAMNPMEFREFLVSKLEENIGLSKTRAEEDADSMIDGKRLVGEGNYCSLVLENGDTYYYKRVNNVWQRDESMDLGSVSNQKGFCVLQQPCIPQPASKDASSTANEGELCSTEDLAQLLLENRTLDAMMSAFDNSLQVSKETMTKIMLEKIDYFSYALPRLLRIRQQKLFQYENRNLRLADSLDDSSESAESQPIESPYARVRDIILGQDNVVKKNSDLVLFANKFTRPANSLLKENTYWRYCVTTNTKLLPEFLFTLASVFVENRNDYVRVVDTICAQQGKLSDDGESWVDQHSGYVIKLVDFDSEEGFESSGFKMVSRDVLEEDVASLANPGGEMTRKYEDPNAQKVYNIISALSNFMGVDLTADAEFIIRNTLLVSNKITGNREDYERKREAAAKKQKKMAAFESVQNTTLMIVGLSFFVTATTLAIPAIKTRKQFPGCVKSFSGFPVSGDGDESALKYVACVANKIKSSVAPWDVLKKMNETGIAKRIRDITNKYIVTDKTIQERIAEKLAYNELEVGDDVPLKHDVKKWYTFLPPLRPYELPAEMVQALTPEFKQRFLDNLKRGNRQQDVDAIALRSRIIHLSLGLYEHIQKIVRNEEGLLSNNAQEPFLENACCFEGPEYKTINYFKTRSDLIGRYNDLVKEYTAIYLDYTEIPRAPFLYSPLNTRREFPPTLESFSEETIYRAFIHFCRFGNALPIPDNLLSFCMSKPTDFPVFAPLAEQITILKQQGKMYTIDDMMRLLKVIEKQNEVTDIDLEIKEILPTEHLKKFLTFLTDVEDPAVSPDFMRHLGAWAESEEATMEAEQKKLTNFLAREITSTINDLTEFIRANGIQNKKKLRVAREFLETLSVWRTDPGDYMDNAIRHVGSVFPEMITHEVGHGKNVPKHWKLSRRHQMDIEMMVEKYYEGLRQFYGDEELTLLLKDVARLTKNLRHLVLLLPNKADSFVNMRIREYVLLQIYKIQINHIATAIVGVAPPASVTSTEVSAEHSRLDEMEDVDEEIGNIAEMDLLSGAQVQLRTKLAAFFIETLGMLEKTKKMLNRSLEDVRQDINVFKEKEKDLVTKRLKDMSKDERAVDTMLKSHKLGVWSKGLSKGTTQYVGTTYDEERELMEEQMALEAKANLDDRVSAMNRDIYIMDIAEETALADAIEQEELAITYMGEDADFEEMGMDGDEMY